MAMIRLVIQSTNGGLCLHVRGEQEISSAPASFEKKIGVRHLEPQTLSSEFGVRGA